ncbi:sensor histidine kinase [Sessilibacter sp. MAH2]
MNNKPRTNNSHLEISSRRKRPFIPDICSLQSVLFLVMGAELIALALVLARSSLSHFDWPILGQLSMLVQWITLISAAILCRIRFWLGSITELAAGCISYLLVVAVSLGFTALSQWMIYTEINSDTLARTGLISAIIGGIVLRYLYLQQQLYFQQQASAEAQISALQARIRPHFLFNSMNSIVSLITLEPEKAERVTLDLCDLFRASLAKPALVSLTTELELVEQYLSIEKLRLDGRLTIRWQKSGDFSVVLIPSMILQPLVENSVYHGIEPIPEGGEIIIEVDASATRVEIRVTNPLFTSQRSARKGNGIALANIRARLSAYCPGASTFETNVNDDTYQVCLSYDPSKLQTDFAEPDLLGR